MCAMNVCLTASESITQHCKYPETCQEAVRDAEAFRNFRNHAGCRAVVDTLGFEQGVEYLNWCVRHVPDSLSLDLIGKYHLNDTVGNPVTFNYGVYGNFCPTTLRYIKVGAEIRNIFGDLSQKNIVEIGGGYGGQCKILSDMGGFASYTIIDLPEVNALIKKYLTLLGVENVFFIDCDKVPAGMKFDLVISNYAFTELDRDQQLHYFDAVIDSTPRGYMTLNDISHLFNIRSLSLKELLQSFKQERNTSLLPEEPNTFFNNALLIWSSGL